MTKPRILIVEDERALTDVLTYNLQREGYEPHVAHDGQEGLRKAQTLLPEIFFSLIRTAAGATAPVGSTTIFIRSRKNFIVGKISSSLIVRTSST